MKKRTSILKKMLFSIVMLSSLALLSCGGGGYTITGTMEMTDETLDSVFIYGAMGKVLASSAVKDNKFVLKGKIDAPQKVKIGNMEANIGSSLILENAAYTVRFTNDAIYVKGGTIHEVVLGFVTTPEYMNLVNEYRTLEDTITVDENNPEQMERARKILDEKADGLMNFEDKIFGDIIEGNYPTLTKLFALTESQNMKDIYTVEKRLELLDKYEKELGKLAVIDDYRTYLNTPPEEPLEPLAVGSPFVNIKAQNKQKEAVELAGVVSNNKYTLIDFWASWCGPCRAEIPNLKKAYERYKSKGFEIYAVSLDDHEAQWLKALDEEQTPWINTWNTEGFKGEVVTAYGISAIPSSFLVDKEGKVVASMNELAGGKLEKVLENLLK